jgi:hypothetical protein
MRKLLVTVIVLAIGAAGYYAYPFWTLNTIVDGLVEKNAEKISAHVDWTRLRESLKAQAQLAVMDAMKSEKPDGFSMLGGLFGGAMVDRLIDAMITPAGLRRMFESPDAKNSTPKVDVATAGFQTLSVFKATFKGADDTNADVFLELTGPSWRVTRIDLPIPDMMRRIDKSGANPAGR